MKHGGHCCLLLFLVLFLLSYSHVSARFLTLKHQGETKVEFQNDGEEVSTLQQENDDSFDMVMGVEKCKKGDKECFLRRVLEDAHLDYIYTQHHNP